MKIINTSKPDGFRVEENGRNLIQVNYTNPIGTFANFKHKGDNYHINPVSLMSYTFSIQKNGQPYGALTRSKLREGSSFLNKLKNFFDSGNSILVINSNPAFHNKKFVFDQGGRNGWFALKDENESILLKLTRDFKLLKLQSEFELEVNNLKVDESDQIELITYLVFFANFYIARNPGTTAG